MYIFARELPKGGIVFALSFYTDSERCWLTSVSCTALVLIQLRIEAGEKRHTYLVLLGTPQNLDVNDPTGTLNLDINDPTGSMNTTLGFHPTNTVKIMATKWRYDIKNCQ